MKTSLTFLILFLTFNSYSQTQAEMNKDSFDDLSESKKELNEVYQKVLDEYKSDTTFLQALKHAQKTWTEFRDAELEMKFPDYKENRYGSFHPVCRASYIKELNEERTEKLKVWLTGVKEGEMCSGSVMFK